MAWIRSRKKGNGGGGTTKSVSYLKWKITKTRSIPAAGALQMEEFSLYIDDVKYSWDSNVSISTDMAGVSGQGIENLIDGTTAKYCTVAWGNTQTNECNIVINLGETITLNENSSYTYTTAGDEISRDPISWILYGSEDGSNWEILDKRTDENIPTTRHYETSPYYLSALSGEKKKNLILSNDVNASSLTEIIIDENFNVTNVRAADHTSYATAYETDLIKFFYDVPGDYHQYYWHVIAVTDVVYNSTNYSAGDIIDYWYYNVTKEMLVEEA